MAKKHDLTRHVDELFEQLDFMRAKLSETSKLMMAEDVVIPYDNGGGQSGIRRNPVFDGYESLLKTYNSTIRVLAEVSDGSVESESKLMDFAKFAQTMKKTAND